MAMSLALVMANSFNANVLSALTILHTLCELGLFMLRALHNAAASLHTAWLHSLSKLREDFCLGAGPTAFALAFASPGARGCDWV